MEEKSNLYIVAIVGVVAVVAMVVLIMGMTTNVVVPSSSSEVANADASADSAGQVTQISQTDCARLENSCYDSDGLNANVPGGFVRYAVCGQAIFLNDTCIQMGPKPTNQGVVEYYCSGNSMLSKAIACPNGCYNGACLVAPTCTDTDGGKNYTLKGTTTFGNSMGYGNATDNCTNSTTLAENYCGTDNMHYIDIHNCPNGCYNGACITPVCGDGRITTPEVCDPGISKDYVTYPKKCVDVMSANWRGFSYCKNDCTGYDTSTCVYVAPGFLVKVISIRQGATNGGADFADFMNTSNIYSTTLGKFNTPGDILPLLISGVTYNVTLVSNTPGHETVRVSGTSGPALAYFDITIIGNPQGIITRGAGAIVKVKNIKLGNYGKVTFTDAQSGFIYETTSGLFATQGDTLNLVMTGFPDVEHPNGYLYHTMLVSNVSGQETIIADNNSIYLPNPVAQDGIAIVGTIN